MILGDLDTGVAAAQLNLIFSIKAIFKRRGRKVASYERLDELLFDPTPLHAGKKYYTALDSSSFRRIISTIANNNTKLRLNDIKSKCSGISDDKINEHLETAMELELISKDEDKFQPSRQVTFGATFEWYVACLCIQELSSFAYWGVKVEGLTGDYDVVLIRENQIGYIECKSGNFSNISSDDIKSFLERERILTPHFSIYIVDNISRGNISRLAEYALEQKLATHADMEIALWIKSSIAPAMIPKFREMTAEKFAGIFTQLNNNL